MKPIMTLEEVLNWALGLDAQQINVWQMGLRAAIIYLAALIMIRILAIAVLLGNMLLLM